MNYETEAWYKLYIRESTEDRLLPVLNRSLRDFLLRLAKSRQDATILAKTENPGEDIARALGGHQDEHDLIVAFVQSMLADGYLTHRRGRLWITNFVEAQLARSPGARRQKNYRENKKKSRQRDARDDNASVTGDARVTAPDDARETSHPRRSEERREDPSRGEPKARPPAATGRKGWPERIVERDRKPGEFPRPRHDPLQEPIPVSRWFPSKQHLAWAKEVRLPDDRFDAALTAARNKLHGAYTLEYWDDKIRRFLEAEVEDMRRRAAPPGLVEHRGRGFKGDPNDRSVAPSPLAEQAKRDLDEANRQLAEREAAGQ